MDFPSYRPPFIDISIGFPMDFPWISHGFPCWMTAAPLRLPTHSARSGAAAKVPNLSMGRPSLGPEIRGGHVRVIYGRDLIDDIYLSYVYIYI